MKSPLVRIIGRFDSRTGVGLHSHAFLKTLSPHAEILLTRGEEYATLDFVDSRVQVHNVKDSASLPEAPISIFCDVLKNRPDDDNYKLAMNAKIKIAYVVFDSSKIPESWVDILNTSFDIAAVPSSFVKAALKESGVKIDIVVLPLALEYRKPKEKKVAVKEGSFTYGFIGSFEERKNIPLLVKAFSNVFENTNVSLRVHIPYSFSHHREMNQLMFRYNSDRIKITSGFIEGPIYLDFFNEIDCFISLSAGEGFSIVPREFMFLGKPVILSKTTAHREIPNVEGVFFIDADIPHPAFYPQIDGRYHGIQFSPYQGDVESLWSMIHEQIGGQREFPELMTYANRFSIENMRALYKQLVRPTSISMRHSSSVDEESLAVSDDRLIEKYRAILGKSLKVESNGAQEKHVVLANDGGFFSVFNRFVSMLVWETDEGQDARVIPDWRISAMRRFYGHENFMSFCYGSELDGNIFIELFEPLAYEDVSIQDYNDNEFLTNDCIFRTDYNEEKEPLLTHVNAYELYHQADFKEWRERYHATFFKHIKLKPYLAGRVNSIVASLFRNHYIIAAHVRHPSHSIEQREGQSPEVDQFKEYIDRQIVEAEKKQPLPVKVFLATDQESVVNYFSAVYKERLITVDATRTSVDQDVSFKGLPTEEKNEEGYQIQHLMASDKDSRKLQMAEEVIVDAWLLANADVFIHIVSNIATAVSFINPNVSMIYCKG